MLVHSTMLVKFIYCLVQTVEYNYIHLNFVVLNVQITHKQLNNVFYERFIIFQVQNSFLIYLSITYSLTERIKRVYGNN